MQEEEQMKPVEWQLVGSVKSLGKKRMIVEVKKLDEKIDDGDDGCGEGEGEGDGDDDGDGKGLESLSGESQQA